MFVSIVVQCCSDGKGLCNPQKVQQCSSSSSSCDVAAVESLVNGVVYLYRYGASCMSLRSSLSLLTTQCWLWTFYDLFTNAWDVYYCHWWFYTMGVCQSVWMFVTWANVVTHSPDDATWQQPLLHCCIHYSITCIQCWHSVMWPARLPSLQSRTLTIMWLTDKQQDFASSADWDGWLVSVLCLGKIGQLCVGQQKYFQTCSETHEFILRMEILRPIDEMFVFMCWHMETTKQRNWLNFMKEMRYCVICRSKLRKRIFENTEKQNSKKLGKNWYTHIVERPSW